MRDLSATFTSKGQIVVPAELRRKYGLKAGTKVKFLEDDFGRMVLQPLTSAYLDRLQDCLAGGPDLLALWKKEHRREGKLRG